MAFDTLTLKELQQKRQTIKNQLATVRGPEAEAVKSALEDVEDRIRIRQDNPVSPPSPKPTNPPPAPRSLDKNALGKSEDWVGNNAAFTCPNCGKVFLVSGVIHRTGRQCPCCAQSVGRINEEGTTASLESVR